MTTEKTIEGELQPHGVWHLLLLDGGRTLKFGALRGTQILIR